MKLKLKRIAPFQAGKIAAAFYGLLSLMFVPLMVVFMALGSFAAKAQGQSLPQPISLLLGMGAGFMLLLPLVYAAMGFVIGVLSAAIYNLLAGWFGGLALEFEPDAPDAPVPPVVQVGS